MRFFVRLSCLALSLVAVPASAQQAPSGLRLSFSREPGAESCADEQGFRDALAAQMNGTDPFTPNGAKRLAITLRRQGSSFLGESALYDEADTPQGSRHLERRTCARLVEDLATSISLLLQPLTMPGRPSPPGDAPSPPSSPPAVLPVPGPAVPGPPMQAPSVSQPLLRDARLPPEPSVASWTRPRVQVGLGGMAGAGTSPDAALGFAGFVGARWSIWSVSLEFRGDLPRMIEVDGVARAHSSLLLGSVSPCWHRGWFLGCGLVSLGAVHQGEAQPPHGTQDAFYAGLGARAGVEFPLGLGNRLALRLLGDGLVNLTRPAVYGNDQRLWRVFPVAGALGGRLLVTF